MFLTLSFDFQCILFLLLRCLFFAEFLFSDSLYLFLLFITINMLHEFHVPKVAILK